MKTKKERAAEYFTSGFNCAQSVLAVFCEDYGLQKESAVKMTSGLGAGFRSGEICGAASGAALVIGLKYGQTVAEDKDSKAICNAKTVEFMKAFKAKNSSVVCRELLRCDMSTSEGYAQAQNKNLFKTVCADLVKSSVEILEDLGY